MVNKKYRIGHTIIEVNLPEIIPIPSNMEKFDLENEKTDLVKGKSVEIDNISMSYDIVITSDLYSVIDSICEGHDVKRIQRESLTVLYIDNKECRLIYTPNVTEPYAVSYEENDYKTKIWIRESSVSMFKYEVYFVSVLSLEKIMMYHDAYVLHSAYICRDGKAILFSAPSETGKSTQADLWEQYRGTRTINGDRSLLIKEKDGWYAYGWPICGSSEICNNEAYPIEAIVMLYQAKENEIKKISGMSIIKKIMSQITINMWNEEFREKAWNMMEALICDIPVYELGCNISEDAVKCLEQTLKM